MLLRSGKEAEPVHQLETPPRLSAAVHVNYAVAKTPTTLLGWLPILWTNMLFPGQNQASSGLAFWPLIQIFLLSGVLLYPCMSFHLFEPDEGRYAQIPREMLTAGEWIVPRLQGEAYLDK